MVIGIISDTHDRADAMRQAVTLLRSRGAEYFIHCGDVGGQGVLDCLAGLPASLVWGNTDHDRVELSQYARSLDLSCHGAMANLEFGWRKIAVLHGDDPRLMQRLLQEQAFDYVMHGHTHVRRDERVGRTRIINPGALHRVREKTVALLNTSTDALEFLTVSP